MYDVSITFGTLPVISLDGRITRGTTPDTWRIRIPHESNLTAAAGDLVFQSSDAAAITLATCIPDLSTLRTEHRDGKREWSLLIRDRRATWPGKPISGRYNKRYRNNAIDGASQLNAENIGALAMAAAGESGSSASLPSTYPDIEWDRTPVNKALDELLSLLPGHVCRDTSDAFSIQTTNDGDGINDDWPNIIPNYLADIESGPQTIRVKCAKTWFGAPLELEAVGLEDNGEYELLDSLSYRPSLGWNYEWPSLFSGVAPGPNRQRAFESVFRCYRVKVPQTLAFGGSSLTLTDLDDLDMDDRRLIWQPVPPPPAFVNGIYWSGGDHSYSTQYCPNVACDFVVDKKNCLIKFEHPIFKIDDCVTAAELKLQTAFHLRNSSTHEWNRETFTIERETGEGEWVLEVPHLWRARALGTQDCTVANEVDNLTTLTAEAQVYLDAWKSHWDSVKDKRHVSVAGIHPVATNGKVAAVKFRIGRGQVPQTTISQHYVPAT